MQVAPRVLSLTVLSVVAAGAIGLQVAFAGEQEYKPKVGTTSLLQTKLAGVEGKEIIIKRFDIPPGFVGAKHYHPGPVFVYVLEGEFTVETEGKGRQTFKAGELYEEPVHHPMLGRNLSTSENLKLLVFQVGDAGKPMMIKTE
jgi:quercetin dioxygenase-like cupin family protein